MTTLDVTLIGDVTAESIIKVIDILQDTFLQDAANELTMRLIGDLLFPDTAMEAMDIDSDSRWPKMEYLADSRLLIVTFTIPSQLHNNVALKVLYALYDQLRPIMARHHLTRRGFDIIGGRTILQCFLI